MLVLFTRLSTHIGRFFPLFRLPCDGYHKIKADTISSGCLTYAQMILQKQPSRRVFYEKVFWKYAPNLQEEEQSHRSVISIKFLFNFIEIALWHRCSPVNLLHIFKTHFPKNIPGRLLLNFSLLRNFWKIASPLLFHVQTMK